MDNGASTPPGRSGSPEGDVERRRREDLRRIEHAITRIGRIGSGKDAAQYRSQRSGVTVSRPAIAILAVLARSSELRVTEIAKQTGLETTLISRELKQLENDGLAERRADELDGRAALIRLSESGRQAFTSYREATDEIIAETFADWTAVELEQLADMLERVLRDFVRTPRVAESASTP